jgi:hypothetical protein
MKILVLGTSHSAGLCSDLESGKVPMGKRWTDHFTNDGHSVINMSMPGCTAHQQFIALYYYLKDHPDRFDLIIVEGRSLDTRISVPYNIVLKNNKDYYTNWQLNEHTNNLPINRRNVNMIEKHLPELLPWYLRYTHSLQHLVDVVSINRMICDLANKYANNVVWFTITTEYYSIDSHHVQFDDIATNIMADYLLDEYFMFSPMLKYENKDLYKCECMHYNEHGLKLLYEAVKNKLEQKKLI